MNKNRDEPKLFSMQLYPHHPCGLHLLIVIDLVLRPLRLAPVGKFLPTYWWNTSSLLKISSQIMDLLPDMYD